MDADISQPPRLSASLRAVAFTDPWAFVASLLAFVIVGVIIVIYVDSQFTGWQPKESWGEVFTVGALLGGLLLTFVWYRREHLNRLLRGGILVKAEVLRYQAFTQWATVQIRYEWRAQLIRKTVWLVNGKRSARLRDRETVTLAIDSEKARRLIITDLYESTQ